MGLRNLVAVQKLKELQTLNITKHNTRRTIIDDAYKIYSQIDGASNHYVINTLLNMSLKYKQAHKMHVMWTDIRGIVSTQKQNCNLSYSLLLKCCIESGNIQRCMQVLLWIERYKYRLKIHDLFIRKLLSQCNNIKYITHIERLIQEKFIENDNKYIKSALITAYARNGSIHHARDAFNSASDTEKDIFMFSAMMKAYINNNEYKNVLKLYDTNHIQHDDVTNMLALKACIHMNDIANGRNIINSIHVTKKSDVQLMHAMIEFYGISAELHKASALFHNIHKTKRTIFTYNAMMSAYLHNSKDNDALDLFDSITKSINKDATAYSLAIKTCCNIQDYARGKCIIADTSDDVYNNIQYKTTLIHFYGSSGDIIQAENVFDSIEDTQINIVNTTTMMNAYMINNRDANALKLYDKITDNQCGFCHDDISNALAIKACGKTMDLAKGKAIHSLHSNNESIQFKNALIDFYGKLQCIDMAQDVYLSIDASVCDVVTIGSMMKAYINNHRNDDALALYDNTKIQLNDVCDMLAIKACTNIGNYDKGKDICANISVHDTTNSMRTTLIEFYGTFEDILSAKDIFDAVHDSKKNDAIVCAMMKALGNCGEYEQVIDIFDRYASNDNIVALLLVIKACTNLGNQHAFEKGKQIYCNTNIHSRMVCNAWIDFFGRYKDTNSIQNVFASITNDEKDVVCINTTMNAWIHCNEHQTALDLYDEMEGRNSRSHMLGIKACNNLGKYEKGKQIHDCFKDVIDDNIYTKSALIDFYGNCLDINTAEDIFNSINKNVHNMVTIGCMMNAYVINNRSADALSLYDNIATMNKTVKPDIAAHILAIKACANTANYETGKRIHDMLDTAASDIKIKTALIDFYGNCHNIETAQDIFLSIDDQHQNIISIGAMMNAYFVNKMYQECVELFQSIQSFNDMMTADILIYRLVLAACSKHEQSFEIRQQIHQCIKDDTNAKSILNDSIVQSNLIGMYAQNGAIDICENIFTEYIESEDNKPALVIWNAMLHAYGRNGWMEKIKSLFKRIQNTADLKPDIYTYSIVLTACSYCGDMQYAEHIWRNVQETDIKYNCILITNLVDCCARKGFVHQAFEYIQTYEKLVYNQPYHAMWRALLGGSVKHNNKTMAQYVYDEYKLRYKDSADEKDHERISFAGVLLSNLYASHSEFDKVETIRNQMESIENEAKDDEKMNSDLYQNMVIDPSRIKSIQSPSGRDEDLFEILEPEHMLSLNGM